MSENRKTQNKTQQMIIKWVLSLISVGYLALLGFLAFASLYYDMQIVNQSAFIALEIILGIIFAGTMIYTRKQFITSVAGLFGPLLYLPIVIFYYSAENMVMLIPLGILSGALFFLSGGGEGIKTILGTIYLLLYVIGILLYYLYVSIFAGNTIDVITYQSVSPSEEYRCYVIDITDSSEGSTRVVIEPNTYDIDYGSVKFVEKGFHRTIYNVRKNKLNIVPEWSSNSKDGDILTINGEVRFRGSDATNLDDAYRYFSTENREYRFLN